MTVDKIERANMASILDKFSFLPRFENENLKFLENIEVELSVEVGRTEITIRELLRLNEGSIVELDRLAGDPLDILANGTKIARGEIVMIGERYGVRFGDIVDPVKRVESVS